MNPFDFSQIKQNAHIHFVGIGGISMSGLAQIMLKNGYKVSGSDRTSSHITEKLSGLGATVYIGHASENIAGADLVVHTAAVHMDNPELSSAVESGIRLIDRAECLGAIMKHYKHAIGIAGTHGKTTTTSMLTHALMYAGTDPTISIGGELDLIGGNIRTGDSDIFVTEACEYTNSFLKFFPKIALITNIEEDHLDFFSGLDEIIESFHKFAALTENGGFVVACGEDENVRRALEGITSDIYYYGLCDAYDYYPENLTYEKGYAQFDVYFRGTPLCHLSLGVPGEHNVLNALSAIAVCNLLAIDIETAARGIETFVCVHRRFEKKGWYQGALIVDDYAHHPTEIKATLKTAKAMNKKSVRCVFQPHTYSRTRTLWQDFLTCFDDTDELILAEIFPAREQFDGVTRSCDLAEQIAARGIHARHLKTFDEIREYLKNTLSEGELLLTMGAGDIYKIADELSALNPENGEQS